MLLGTFVNEVWWPSCGKLRECTRVGYESAYRCHIQPKWADVDMESITANDIEEWLGSFNQAGAARKAWAVLRAILRLAYRKGVTDNDVTRREIRLPHLRRYEPRVLDARQVRRLLKGFNEFVDNSYEDHMENRFLYVAGNTVSFRTSRDATIPANTWHVGSVSFPVTTV